HEQVPQVGVRPDELARDPDPQLDQRVADEEGVLQRDALAAAELRPARAEGPGRAEQGEGAGAVARGPEDPLGPGRLSDLGLHALPGRRVEARPRRDAERLLRARQLRLPALLALVGPWP